MSRKLFFCAFAILCLVACGPKRFPTADNALDAGREFLDGCLKGDFTRASAYMLHDEKNEELLNDAQAAYNKLPDTKRSQYANASITILEVDQPRDREAVISYRNSVDQVARKLKVVNQDKSWLADFKYTFSGNL